MFPVSGLSAGTSLLQYIRDVARLRGTKFMCREGGCGACVVNLTFTDPFTTIDKSISVNSVSNKYKTMLHNNRTWLVD